MPLPVRIAGILLLASFCGSGLLVAANDPVVVMKLRMPHHSGDPRPDPYYDLGREASFGITGCHRTTAMKPANVVENLLGKRVAFVQGGLDPATGMSQQRLVFLTPPLTRKAIEIVGTHRERRMAILKWDGTRLKPLKFASAPIVVANDGAGMPSLLQLARTTARDTIVGGFGSLFRTRTKPLEESAAEEMIEAWEAAVREAHRRPDLHFAQSYVETMSPPPVAVDRNRRASYQAYQESAMSGLDLCVPLDEAAD